MATGGLTGMYNFRKIYSEKAEKSPYAAIVKTKEELEREQNNKAMEEDSVEEMDEE
jgi:hypothetical protein